MDNYDKIVDKYLDFCSSQKRLNLKTIKAYSTDLKQVTCQGNCTFAGLIARLV